MLVLAIVLMAIAAGFTTGVVQVRLFSKSDCIKPLPGHLDDLRAYIRTGCLVLALVVLPAILLDPRFETVQWTTGAFILSLWTGATLGGRKILDRLSKQ